MKAIIIFCLLASGPAYAGVDLLYALRCPGRAAPILSYRHDWEKAGFAVPDSGTMDQDKETAFQIERLSALSHLFAQEVQVPLPENTIWQKGIRFQPEGFGLPPSIDGCEVVPFVMRNQDGLGGAFAFVGSLDDFQSLPPLDQWVARFILHDNDLALLRAFFSDEAARLPLSDREGLLYHLNWTHVSYLDFDVMVCTDWWDARTPRWCDQVVLPGAEGATDGTFWRNGLPKAFSVGSGGNVRLSYDRKSANYSKFRRCAGIVTYGENGAFARCN